MRKQSLSGKILIIIWPVIFGLSCKNTRTYSSDIPYQLSPGLKVDMSKLDSAKLTGFARDIRFIPLETRSDILIRRVDRLKVTDSLLFVLDIMQKTIFIFDKSGKYISKISKAGKGGDEYRNIDDFDPDESQKEIYVLDNLTSRLLIYDFQGRLVKENKLPFHALEFSRLPGGYAFCNGNSCVNPFCDKVYFCNKAFAVVHTDVPIQSNLRNLDLMSDYPRLIKVGDSIRFVDINDFIYSFLDGKLMSTQRVDFGHFNRKVSFYDQKFMNANDLASKQISDRNAGLSGYLENEQMVMVKFYISGRTFVYLYSKEKKHGIVLRETGSYYVDGIPTAIRGNECYEPAVAADFFRQSSEDFSATDSVFRRQLRAAHPAFREEDNPVIVKYSLNF